MRRILLSLALATLASGQAFAGGDGGACPAQKAKACDATPVAEKAAEASAPTQGGCPMEKAKQALKVAEGACSQAKAQAALAADAGSCSSQKKEVAVSGLQLVASTPASDVQKSCGEKAAVAADGAKAECSSAKAAAVADAPKHCSMTKVEVVLPKAAAVAAKLDGACSGEAKPAGACATAATVAEGASKSCCMSAATKPAVAVAAQAPGGCGDAQLVLTTQTCEAAKAAKSCDLTAKTVAVEGGACTTSVAAHCSRAPAASTVALRSTGSCAGVEAELAALRAELAQVRAELKALRTQLAPGAKTVALEIACEPAAAVASKPAAKSGCCAEMAAAKGCETTKP